MATFLVIDDNHSTTDALCALFSRKGHIAIPAYNGEHALRILNSSVPDLVLLDINMPYMDGYEFIRHLKTNPATTDIPVVFLSAYNEIDFKTQGFDLGAEDYITKPFDIRELQARIQIHLSRHQKRLDMENQNKQLKETIDKYSLEMAVIKEAAIDGIATLAEFRDPETGSHLLRTQYYMKTIAENLARRGIHRSKLSTENIEVISHSSRLHDIGKVGIPDRVLLKPGKLSGEEWELMKQHPAIGRDTILAAERRLGADSFLHFSREIAFSHHEKWDGKGYPVGLCGEAIPLSGRMMALADTYDALVTERPYKKAFSHEKAIEIISEERGAQFDPDIVDAFLGAQKQFHEIAHRFADRMESQIEAKQQTH